MKNFILLLLFVQVFATVAQGQWARTRPTPYQRIVQRVRQLDKLYERYENETNPEKKKKIWKKVRRMAKRIDRHIKPIMNAAEINLHRQLRATDQYIRNGQTPLNGKHLIDSIKAYERIARIENHVFDPGKPPSFRAYYVGRRDNFHDIGGAIYRSRSISTMNRHRDRTVLSAMETPISRNTMLWLRNHGLLSLRSGKLRLNHQSHSTGFVRSPPPGRQMFGREAAQTTGDTILSLF